MNADFKDKYLALLRKRDASSMSVVIYTYTGTDLELTQRRDAPLGDCYPYWRFTLREFVGGGFSRIIADKVSLQVNHATGVLDCGFLSELMSVDALLEHGPPPLSAHKILTTSMLSTLSFKQCVMIKEDGYISYLGLGRHLCNVGYLDVMEAIDAVTLFASSTKYSRCTECSATSNFVESSIDYLYDAPNDAVYF